MRVLAIIVGFVLCFTPVSVMAQTKESPACLVLVTQYKKALHQSRASAYLGKLVSGCQWVRGEDISSPDDHLVDYAASRFSALEETLKGILVDRHHVSPMMDYWVSDYGVYLIAQDFDMKTVLRWIEIQG